MIYIFKYASVHGLWKKHGVKVKDEKTLLLDSRLTRSATVVESGTVRSAWTRWKPTETQKRILESIFASGIRNPSTEHINRITAELQRHGPVEGKNIFYWFQNAAARDKRKKEAAESSSKWPSVFKPRNWTSLFHSKRSSDKSSVQEEDVCNGARRNSSVDPSEMRTLNLFPVHQGI